mmetsp:Transcript_22060/g.35499  ORF Transcript_22060/g.35499 Transcript_22060/m.35499 type:complete len:739 (-) Transcript_22060:125-2341(-)|eukprot:CAMPEP_0178762682 /NCGR_PEP_ID=MMETSP0744-20121128/16676_1 /TAXON_ID=913974 /ORGANISM="Nitzschia punctata, Strain CCMP561" /LENGTH=738 /DNA_ID=CAMNT_0020417383 /DNA_START=301 /DNA_END=2517 /DNA_ORIENTATION=+
MANESSSLLSAPETVHKPSGSLSHDMLLVGSPKDRLKVRVAQTPPTHEASTPMSTCSSAATPTEATYSNQSITSEESTTPSLQPSTISVRVPLPSPARGRLDRQYAKRLAASSVFFQTTPTARTPARTAVTTSSTPTLSGMGPPGMGSSDYDSSCFRPTPIISSSQSPESDHVLNAPRRFFFPSSSSVTREESANSLRSFHSKASSGISSATHSSRRRRLSPGISPMDLGTSDRFIPSRATSNMNINLWDSMNGSSNSSRRNSTQNDTESEAGNDGNGSNASGTGDDSNTPSSSASPAAGRANDPTSATQQSLHNILLRSELLGENISPYSTASQINNSTTRLGAPGNSPPLRDGMNRLRFQSPRQAYQENVFNEGTGPTSVVNSFSLTPFGSASSQRLMAAPQKRRRKIAKVPFKVLDAPALQDDFYLNLVDWSSQNVLAVGLGSCVYLWSACTSKVTKLCDLAQAEDIVTSVSWAQRGTHLAVGTNKGEVQLWDTIKVKKVRTMSGHSARVGTLAWTGPILASGSRDRLIFLRDVRAQSPFSDRLSAHRQEVCGLRWSFDEPAFLASGGNDNQLHVVDSRNPVQPVHRFSDHTAAVKAIAWSPHQHGLLASGGGTADRCIRFWNTLSGSALSSVDTGSQVCNLAWSQNCNEIVSTHGYSLNQIVVWRYPSLSKVVTLTGHTYRVLYLAVSPDGSTIVTGAGDETLRFWQVFPGPRSDAKNNAGGLLFPNTLGSVIR